MFNLRIVAPDGQTMPSAEVQQYLQTDAGKELATKLDDVTLVTVGFPGAVGGWVSGGERVRTVICGEASETLPAASNACTATE